MIMESREFFNYSKSEQNKAGTKRYGDSFEHLYRKHIGDQQGQNFSQDNIVVQKKDETKKRLK